MTCNAGGEHFLKSREEKDDLINESVNEKVVYRTASAVPGLLIITKGFVKLPRYTGYLNKCKQKSGEGTQQIFLKHVSQNSDFYLD